MMLRPNFATTAAFMMALAICAPSANAQYQQPQSSSGLFGSRSVGGGVTAGSSSAFGSASQGQGGLAQPAQQSAGLVTGNERFVRDARAPGQFVGADSADSSAFNSMQQTGGRNTMMRGNQFSQFNQLGQFLRNQQFNPNQAGANAPRQRAQIPVALRLGFEAPVVPAAPVQTRLTTRVQRVLNVAPSRPVTINVEGRVAILRGTVATEHEKLLAEKLAMLEPGISEVKNDLVVAPPR